MCVCVCVYSNIKIEDHAYLKNIVELTHLLHVPFHLPRWVRLRLEQIQNNFFCGEQMTWRNIPTQWIGQWFVQTKGMGA